MISTKFSIVDDIELVDESNYNYVADPTDNFTLTFNGEHIYNVSGQSFATLFGKLLICWMDGVHTFYVILKPNKLIRIDNADYKLCSYLVKNHELIREIESLDDIRTFVYL